jgi:hypothetical protein
MVKINPLCQGISHQSCYSAFPSELGKFAGLEAAHEKLSHYVTSEKLHVTTVTGSGFDCACLWAAAVSAAVK